MAGQAMFFHDTGMGVEYVAESLAGNHRLLDRQKRFPRGVDIILAAPGGLACLPRTTRIKMEA